MARVTHVKAARQRFKTVPVLDENGKQVVTVVRRRDGTPKTTKTGREVTMRQTVADKSQPLPNLRCDFSGCTTDGGEILVGTPYKHITPRSGPYGGSQRNRHESCPAWNVWDYSYSRRAQVARTQNDMHNEIDGYEFTAQEDFDALQGSLAEMAGVQRDEQEEALGNMPEGLQDGSQAQGNVEILEAWVEEIENADEPDVDFFEDCDECDGSQEKEEDCDECGGTGAGLADDEDCSECSGTGRVQVECLDCDGGKSDVISEDWIETAKDALREVVDGCEI